MMHNRSSSVGITLRVMHHNRNAQTRPGDVAAATARLPFFPLAEREDYTQTLAEREGHNSEDYVARFAAASMGRERAGIISGHPARSRDHGRGGATVHWTQGGTGGSSASVLSASDLSPNVLSAAKKNTGRQAARATPNAARGALRQAFTIIELLVVIFIVLAITAIAIGIAVPDVQQRKIREGAREVNGFLQGARNRAAESGRDFGVLLLPADADARMCTTLQYVEVAQPYSGDTIYSRAVVQTPGAVGQIEVFADVANSVNDVGWRGLLRPGDLIQLNYQGHLYRILAPGEGGTSNTIDGQGYITNTQWWVQPVGTEYALRNPGVAMPYTVFRQPSPSNAPPLELPEGVCISLDLSGTETPFAAPFYDFNNEFAPVVIMFSPNGQVSGVRYPQPILGSRVIKINSPIYLHIGRRDQVNIPGNLLANAFDLQTLWVAINQQTGNVTTTENNGDGNGDGTITPEEARYFARRAHTMVGR